jgi:hypothetical protein
MLPSAAGRPSSRHGSVGGDQGHAIVVLQGDLTSSWAASALWQLGVR